jgi:hypothetical protein
LYHLLPSVEGGIDFAEGIPRSLFDSGAWQPSVLQTLQEFVRLHAVRRQDPGAQARALFEALLLRGRQHRDRIERFTMAQAGLQPSDWLCVVGVGAQTRIGMYVKQTRTGPDFVFDSSVQGRRYRDDQWATGTTLEERSRTGDGTVPFQGALPGFLPRESIVCVTPDDYGSWELQDRVLSAAAGFHAILPNMDMLHRLIVRHFTGRPDRRNTTWGRPAPGVAGKAWAPPIPRLRNEQGEQ